MAFWSGIRRALRQFFNSVPVLAHDEFMRSEIQRILLLEDEHRLDDFLVHFDGDALAVNLLELVERHAGLQRDPLTIADMEGRVLIPELPRHDFVIGRDQLFRDFAFDKLEFIGLGSIRRIAGVLYPPPVQ